MQQLDCDVIIVGGGIVGMTLACALLQKGMHVIIIEANAPPAHQESLPIDIRTVALTRAAERILTHLNVWQNLQRISPFRHMHVWDAAGSGVIDFDSAALHEATLGYIVEQNVLLAALQTRLAEYEHLTWYAPAQIQNFKINNQYVTVQLTEQHTLTSQLLIGADGGQSTVRTLAGIAYQLQDYGQRAIVAQVQTVLPHQQTAWQRFLPTGPLAFLPLSHPHSSSIVWSLTTPEAQRLMSLETEAFQEQLAQAFGFKLGAVNQCSQRLAVPLRSQHVQQYIQARLALVGDAAHTIHPLAGQGVNLGLLDVAVLSEVLLEAYGQQRDFGHYQILRRYERWRKGENLLMLKTMTAFNQLFSNATWPLTWARTVGLNVTQALTPVKSILMKRAMGLSGDLPQLAKFQG